MHTHRINFSKVKMFTEINACCLVKLQKYVHIAKNSKVTKYFVWSSTEITTSKNVDIRVCNDGKIQSRDIVSFAKQRLVNTFQRSR